MRDVPLRVLMVEDRPTDAERILHELREAGFTTDWQCVQTETEYLGALDPAPDIVLVDSDLAAFDPLRAPQLLHERRLDIPCIVVSDPSPAARVAVGVQPEAATYPWKARLEYVGQAVASVLKQRGLRVRQQAENALYESEERFHWLVESIQDYAIFMLDPAGRVVSWNNGAERIKGYRAEEIIGQHFSRFYTAEDRARRKPARALQRARAQGQFKDEGWRVRKDGTQFWADVVITALRDEAGQLCGFAKVTRDMTERRQAEEALRASERRFREVLQHMQLAAVVLDTQGRVTFCNDCLLELTGYRVEEVIGQDWFARFIPPEQCEFVRRRFLARLTQQLRSPRRRQEILTCQGERRLMDWTRTHLTDTHGVVVGVAFIGVDVTARQRMEAALKHAKGQLEALVKERTRELRQVNEALVADIARREQTELALQARIRQQLIVAELGKHALAGLDLSALMDEAAARITRTLDMEYCKIWELLPDGQALWLRAGVGWKEGVVGHVTLDVGPQFQAGYTLLSKEPVIVRDLRTETRFSGPSFLHEHGVVSGMSVIIPGRERPFGVLGADTTQLRIYTADDIHFLQSVANVLAMAIERKGVEVRLQASLAEKEVLLKEIHHRVKNNLQVVSSLLTLQAGVIQDPHAREVFKESQRRVRAMALVHEKLYQSKNLAQIDFGAYIHTLVAQLYQLYRVPAQCVTFRITAEAMMLGIETAIPCGLILQELLSNCLKYAFPAGRSGEVHVVLRGEPPGRYTLVVHDTGVGFPEGVDFHHTQSLGLQLVHLLTEQLDGTIALERGTGTTVTLIFPDRVAPTRGCGAGASVPAPA